MHLVAFKALKEELLPCLGYRPLHKCPGRASGESPRAAQAYTATAVQKLIKLVTCQILSHLVTFCHSEAMLTNMSTEIAQKRRLGDGMSKPN